MMIHRRCHTFLERNSQGCGSEGKSVAAFVSSTIPFELERDDFAVLSVGVNACHNNLSFYNSIYIKYVVIDSQCEYEYKIEMSDDYKPMWRVEFRRNEMCGCYAFTGENVKHGTVYNAGWGSVIFVYINAKDEEHAKKIAKDIYMKWLAEQNNL